MVNQQPSRIWLDQVDFAHVRRIGLNHISISTGCMEMLQPLAESPLPEARSRAAATTSLRLSLRMCRLRGSARDVALQQSASTVAGCHPRVSSARGDDVPTAADIHRDFPCDAATPGFTTSATWRSRRGTAGLRPARSSQSVVRMISPASGKATARSCWLRPAGFLALGTWLAASRAVMPFGNVSD